MSTTVTIALDELREEIARLFVVGGKKEADQQRRDALAALRDQIFHNLAERLIGLDWKNRWVVDRALRPYMNGMFEERRVYLQLMQGTTGFQPLDRWGQIVKAIQAKLNRLRAQMLVEVDVEPVAEVETAGEQDEVVEEIDNQPSTEDGPTKVVLTEVEVPAATEAQTEPAKAPTSSESVETPAAQPEPTEIVEDLDDGKDSRTTLAAIINDRIGDVEASLDLLEEELTTASRRSLEMVAWIIQAETELAKETARRRLLTTKDKRDGIDTWANLVRSRIETVRAKQQLVETAVAALNNFKRRLKTELNALVAVRDCLDSEVELPDSPDLQEWNPPALADLFAEAEAVQPALPTEEEADEDKAASDEPVRQFEAFLHSFCGQTEEEIRRRLPYAPPKNLVRYYGLLIDGLGRGTFLDDLKMACVVLNAARKDGRPATRLAARIMTLMKSREVRLSTFTGVEATNAGHALGLIHILGLIEPRWRLIDRVSVGNQWGLGNRLTATGLSFATTWTSDLLAAGRVSQQQLTAIARTVEDWDRRGHDKKEDEA